MGFENPVVGGTALRIPAIQSPNYSPGVAGWIIKINGDAEFNNLTIRGEFLGADFIINSSGIFLYNGTPAAGNLVGSWTAAAGTDQFGNAYDIGLNIYSPLGSIHMDPTDGLFQSLSANNNLVIINDGQISFKHVGDDSNAIVLQNFGGTANGSLTLSSGKLNSSDTSAFMALVSKTIGIDPQFLINNYAGGQLSFMNDTIDQGRGVQSMVSITANVTGITTTEVVVMTIPSMTFKNGRAYRVTLWGLQQSTTADTYFLHRLRKGSASTSGTIYKDQMRVPVINAASTNGAVSLTFNLENTSGADITTALTWTASCAAGTGIFAASAGNVATATVEDVGLASQWPGQPVS